MENSNGKKTLGRRKIPMRKIEKKSSLQVAFTKRRGGLFRKAAELSILCGAEIAILVQSPSQKLYAFGHPSAAALINRCDDCGCGAAMKMVEAEKRRSTEKEIKEKPYEGLELHDFGEKVEKTALPLLQEAASSSNQIKINDQIIPTYTLDQIWGRD
ncbi:agamous-like MADS-box protein AGL29 isoform X2 [Salvia splendens]|uniref:agamous-like MADS-box protein AGL29 isoform X2 n=1 Tax=Salvia splendens TaxID=180675 RepID=UPI001C26593D|nr:agamous-like MADS-box protein AGL29 isoform X2 [Salvia splendens]